jgi:hypothetical protein
LSCIAAKDAGICRQPALSQAPDKDQTVADANGHAAGGAGGAEAEALAEPVVIKKYANRRLYNTAASST